MEVDSAPEVRWRTHPGATRKQLIAGVSGIPYRATTRHRLDWAALWPPRTSTAHHPPYPIAAPSSAVTATGITVYGCEPDETALFGNLAPSFGITPVVTGEPVSEANADLAHGNRCISIGHKTQVENSTLLALGRAGVAYHLHAKHPDTTISM
ncbi:hypothetical protein ACU686_14155 [Yinghuangia aomiensis]